MEPLPLGDPTASQTMTYPRRVLGRILIFSIAGCFRLLLQATVKRTLGSHNLRARFKP